MASKYTESSGTTTNGLQNGLQNSLTNSRLAMSLSPVRRQNTGASFLRAGSMNLMLADRKSRSLFWKLWNSAASKCFRCCDPVSELLKAFVAERVDSLNLTHSQRRSLGNPSGATPSDAHAPLWVSLGLLRIDSLLDKAPRRGIVMSWFLGSSFPSVHAKHGVRSLVVSC